MLQFILRVGVPLSLNIFLWNLVVKTKNNYLFRGFLHGFSVLAEDAIVNIKIDRYFASGESIGIKYDDEYLCIGTGD